MKIQYNATTQTVATQGIIQGQADVNGNLKATLATELAGEDLTNDVLKVQQQFTYLNGTTSQLVKTGAGQFAGFIISSHTSGTIKFWDNTSAATTVLVNTITLAAGPGNWILPIAFKFATGLYVTVGGTVDYTIAYN